MQSNDIFVLWEKIIELTSLEPLSPSYHESLETEKLKIYNYYYRLLSNINWEIFLVFHRLWGILQLRRYKSFITLIYALLEQ